MFGPCPAGYVNECATLQVPLNHADPSGETIDLFIARQRSATPATRQLWLLSGGPGQGGYIFEGLVPLLAESLPETDIYVIDHRGTGSSHRLTCAAQEGPESFGGYVLPAEGVPGCLAELETKGDLARLPYFTTAQSASDLLFAIRATRSADQQVHVFGASYGTHWAHRALQLNDGEVDGFVFDGFMTPEKFGFTQYDKGVEEVGSLLMAGCAANNACSSRLGPDPEARIRALWAKLDETPCGDFDGRTARTIVSVFVDQGIFEKPFVFPLIHRLERCNSDDLTAINYLVDGYFNALGAPTAPPLNSGVLQYNIALSELWSIPGEGEPTAAELTAAAEAQTFLVGDSYPASIAQLRKSWPLPPNDYAGLPLPVPTSSPMLWLSGGLDTRTPPTQSLAVSALYDAENQPLVVLASATHTPALASPRASNPSSLCGLDIVTSFIRGTLDTSCTEDLFPVLYQAPNAQFANAWWGTTDDWGDDAAVPAPAPRVQPIALPGFRSSLGAWRAHRALRAVLRK